MSAHQVLAQLANADWNIADPGASGTITVHRSGTCEIISAGSEARTLAAPTQSDLEIAIVGKTIPSGTVTVTIGSSGSYTEAGDTAFTITSAGQFMLLRSFEIAAGTFAWRRIASDTTEAVAFPAATVTTLTATTAVITSSTTGGLVAASATGITVTDDTGGVGTAGFGSATSSAIGEATQQTNINTTVVINSAVGKITTVSSNLAAAGHEEFTLTNASIANGDIVICNADTAGNGSPLAWATKTANGSCVIALENRHGSAAFSAAIVISFIVHKVTISA